MERCTELTVPVSVREEWQRLGKSEQRETALHQTPRASAASYSLLFIYSLSAELQIYMRADILEVLVKRGGGSSGGGSEGYRMRLLENNEIK